MSEKNDEKSALVPRLRFPEFLGEGTWRNMPLSEACRVTQGGTPDTTVAAYWGGTIQWITPAEMGKGESKYIKETVRTITDEGLANCSSELLPVDSVVISTRAPIGHLAINQAPMAINQGCRGLVRNQGFNTHFIFFSLEKSKAQLNDLGSGNTFKELSGTSLKKFGVPFPGSEEQKKIADCLSSLDDLITAETQKLDALKTHKKGLMQQLFPREGEAVPRLRFPEFREAGEWEQKSLGEAATFYNGRAYAKEELLERGKYTVIRVGNFFTSDKWYYSDLELDESKYCDDGDLLYAWSASFGPRIWRGNKSIYHYHIWKVVESVGVSRKFLFIALDIETERMKARSANGIGMFHITKGTIESWMSVFPALAEQQKIADCVSSLDDLITAQSQKINTLKTHKKGLMQQLFPVLEEVPA